jgi:hypothetical protein
MFGVDTSIMWESPKIQNLFVTGQSKMAHCTEKKKSELGRHPPTNEDESQSICQNQEEEKLLLISQFAMPQFSRVKKPFGSCEMDKGELTRGIILISSTQNPFKFFLNIRTIPNLD